MIINTYTLLLKVRSGKGKSINRTWDFFRKRILKIVFVDFPGGTVDKNLPANVGDTVWSLVREDNTCYGTTKPVHHNCWARTLWSACCNYWSLQALGPMSHNYWACVPKLLKPVRLEPVELSSVQSLSRVWLFVTPWTAACQAYLSITNSRSSPKLVSIESVMPSNHLILCHPLLLLPSILPNIRVFSNRSVLRIRWPKYRSFSFSISPSNEYLGLISFRMD